MIRRGLLSLGLLAAIGVGWALGQGGLGITGTESQWRNSIFEVGILRTARDTAITATAGGSVTTSYQLVYGLNRITTVATGGDGVKLPSCIGGKSVIVINAAASNSLNVFPNTSTEVINALSAGAAFALAANKTVVAYCGNDGNWYTNLTASLPQLFAANDNRKGLRRAA